MTTRNAEKAIAESTNRVAVMACPGNCYHEFQNRQYKGLRVFNAKGSPAITGWRCTVCNTEVQRKE